jgi:DNA-binding MarR family transcriptional regulator
LDEDENMPRLQDELKKKKPFACPEQEAALNLFRTSDRLEICFARLLREHNLSSPSQYNVLRILRGEGKPMRCRDIAERTITMVPGLTGLIDRLAAADLVTRERSAEDRREVFVAITDKGLRLLAELDEPIENLHRQVLGHLTAEELAELSRLLEKARARCCEESS